MYEFRKIALINGPRAHCTGTLITCFADETDVRRNHSSGEITEKECMIYKWQNTYILTPYRKILPHMWRVMDNHSQLKRHKAEIQLKIEMDGVMNYEETQNTWLDIQW